MIDGKTGFWEGFKKWALDVKKTTLPFGPGPGNRQPPSSRFQLTWLDCLDSEPVGKRVREKNGEIECKHLRMTLDRRGKF